MKLNFWQWLGVALLIAGGIVYWLDKKRGDKAPEPPVAPQNPTITTSPS